MLKIQDYMQAVEEIAPFGTALSWDNVGLMVGSPGLPVNKALLALDVTGAVLEEAVEVAADLIITHHPLLFHPLKRIPADSLPYRLITKGISVISAHTNLDMAQQGVNFALAQKLCLKNLRPLALVEGQSLETGISLGLIGDLDKEQEAEEFAAQVKSLLHAPGLKYCQGGACVRTVAVCGGSGMDYAGKAMEMGAQALVSSEAKHHEWLEASERGMTLIDAGHYHTEAVVMEPLARMLEERLPGAEIVLSQRCTDGVRFL